METAISSSPIKWERLCRNISNRNVIAVIGNEMYQFRQNGKMQDMEAFCAGELLTRNGLDASAFNTIGGAVEFLLNEQGADIRDIIDDLKLIVAQAKELPLLESFLAIDRIYFYVNTTVYGNILEDKIAQYRHENSTEGNFSINETFADFGNISALEVPFVFNIFGSLSNNVAPALKEEEMLEFTTSLITKIGDARFASILDALKNKTLIFLGCSQPYWLIRFMFRLLSNDRIDNWQRRLSEIIIVNDKTEFRESQFHFLKNYKAITYEGSTAEFVEELKSRWTEHVKLHPPKPKSIFLSYSHKDKEAADRIYEKIAAIEFVQVWYDNNRLESGDNFNDKIVENINEADLFIPLISDNSLAGENTYVKREWACAYNQNIMQKLKRPGKKSKYMLPVVIDNTFLGNPEINQYFPSLSIAAAPAGNADDQFIDLVKRQLELI